MLTAPQRWQQKVVDIGGWNNESGGWLHVWNRTTANIWQAINQQWRVEKAGAGSKIVSMMNGLCLVVQSNVVGAHAVTDTCASGGATWTFAGGQLRLLAPTTALITQHAPFCLSVEHTQNCSSQQAGDGKPLPFCDSQLPAPKRAADLASRLSVAEMLAIMSPAGSAVPRLGVPSMGHQECQHGVWEGGTSCGSGAEPACPTSFPNLLSETAADWDCCC